jgi:hypothetical protein
MIEPENNLEAPAKLITALKEAARHSQFIPPVLDATILKAAERHLQQNKRRSLRFKLSVAWAAVFTLVVFLPFVLPLSRKTPQRLSQTRFARADINHDGRVDILDAFALAKMLETHHSVGTAADLNGDGAVDERDVTIIAAEAVSLDKESGS